jgi:hypothetical protein
MCYQAFKAPNKCNKKRIRDKHPSLARMFVNENPNLQKYVNTCQRKKMLPKLGMLPQARQLAT